MLSEQVLQLSSVHPYRWVPLGFIDIGLVFREVYEWAGVQQASHWLDSLFFWTAYKAAALFFSFCVGHVFG